MNSPPAKQYKIAVIPGDGIGKEVVPDGIRALEAAGRCFGFSFAWTEFDWSCEAYLSTGRMMPADGLDRLRAFDAIFLGAVGHPQVPDHISLWGLLIPIRRASINTSSCAPFACSPESIQPSRAILQNK